jgi:osmotically-inducible protein OsmY
MTMSTATLTKADVRVRDAVMRELKWDPEVDMSAVGVVVTQGAVSLLGLIDTYSGKLAAERAAKRVHGVRAVANDLEVRLRLERPDPDIAKDAARALELRDLPEAVQAAVHRGHVTLTGKVGWLYERAAAERAVQHIRGVRGVVNHISAVSKTDLRDVRSRIVKALHQNADVDARNIAVAISGHTATLTGTVHTWLQRESAEAAVSCAPGVAHVDNQIAVRSSLHPEDNWDDEC